MSYLIVENVHANHASAQIRRYLNDNAHLIVENLILVVPSSFRIVVEFMTKLVLSSSLLVFILWQTLMTHIIWAWMNQTQRSRPKWKFQKEHISLKHQ